MHVLVSPGPSAPSRSTGTRAACSPTTSGSCWWCCSVWRSWWSVRWWCGVGRGPSIGVWFALLAGVMMGLAWPTERKILLLVERAEEIRVIGETRGAPRRMIKCRGESPGVVCVRFDGGSMNKRFWLATVGVVVVAGAISIIALPKGPEWTTSSPEALAEFELAMTASKKLYHDDATST